MKLNLKLSAGGLQLKLRYLILMLVIISVNANESNMDTCINVANNFNEQAISSLFNKKVDIKINTVNRAAFGSSGCSVEMNVRFNNSSAYTNLGSVIIFRYIANNYQLFKSAEKKFVQKDQLLYWGNELPFVEEGFIDTKDLYNQTFNAYLKNKDYVIFIYNGRNNSESQSYQGVSTNFINFINIMFQQIIHY